MDDGLLALVLLGIVLFAIIGFVALLLDRFAHFLFGLLLPDAKLADQPSRRRGSRLPTVKELRDDPQLIAFFKRSDPRFAREFPSLAGPPSQPADSTYTPAIAPKHVLRTAAPEYIINPTAAISEAEIASPSQPVIIRERLDPQLINEAPVPQPASVRPDPVAVSPTSRASPQPASAAAPDADLTTIMQLWPGLSARDRHELVELARLKAQP